MKKGLIVFSVVTTLIAVGLFVLSTAFFAIYLRGMITGSKGDTAAGFAFYVVFNVFTMAGVVLNFIPNLILFIRYKSKRNIILFIIAVVILVAAVTMFSYILIRYGNKPNN